MLASLGSGAYGTLATGQVRIAVTGTAVQLAPKPNYSLYNGLIISAKWTNNVAGATIGSSSVTNVVDGTGNGQIIQPGASIGLGVSQINNVWVNGTAGDIFSWSAR